MEGDLPAPSRNRQPYLAPHHNQRLGRQNFYYSAILAYEAFGGVSTLLLDLGPIIFLLSPIKCFN